MAISSFDKRVLIEQVRYMEADKPFESDGEETGPGHEAGRDFEERLWLRARYLVERFDLEATVGRAARLSRLAVTVSFLLAVVLGGLGVLFAVTGLYSINIYWLLLVLIGFNLLSMLLWLIGISMNMQGLTSGVLARLARWMPRYLDRKGAFANRPAMQADRAWLTCHFTGTVGKWHFSSLTHQLWLAYLFAGLVLLFLLLLVRQYDFVWGTTLLSQDFFVAMTELLSAPLRSIGFATPGVEQVLESRIGAVQAAGSEHRYHWAQFLLGSLLCYGILPRSLLWIISALMERYARRQFALDTYLPYYIHLRQRLVPLASHGEIIDEDTHTPVPSGTPVPLPQDHALPEAALWVAVEPDSAIAWPPPPVPASGDCGQVVDRESLQRVRQQLQSKTGRPIAVAVSSARAPDRGVQRTIKSLVSCCDDRWLVLMQKHEDASLPSPRLAAWYRTAEICGVPADHVIHMRVA